MTTRKSITALAFALALGLGLVGSAMAGEADLYDRVKHGYADSQRREDPLRVARRGPARRDDPRVSRLLVHVAPPDGALSDRFQVVAIDQRGYNLSDKPKGVENYDVRLLVGDVAAVIKPSRARQGDHRRPRLGRRGRVAVRDQPAADDREPDHPEPAAPERAAARAAQRTRSRSEEQRVRAQLSNRRRQRSDSVLRTADDSREPVGWVQDPEARSDTSRRSDARTSRRCSTTTSATIRASRHRRRAAGLECPRCKAPVLMFHGLDDTALQCRRRCTGTWNWLEKDLTLVTVPGAGHFVQQDAADLVTKTMRWWLAMRAAR